MEVDTKVHGNGPAVYYHIPGYKGSIGFISAMHGKFCSSCNRIRMSAIGELKPCLCYNSSVSIRETLREEGEVAAGKLLRQAILQKPEAHCFEHWEEITEKRKMIEIGG
jgi:cyclic pyranopterin phosphate synthase